MPQSKIPQQDPADRPGQVESGNGIDMGILPRLIGYMLRQGQLCVYHDFFKMIGDEGIRPPQFSILEVVGHNPGIRPSDVAAAIGVKRANLVPLLAALQQNGWITRTTAAADRRAQSLHLSQAGTEKLAYWHSLIGPHEDRMAARLGPQGRDHLLRLLQTLVRGTA